MKGKLTAFLLFVVSTVIGIAAEPEIDLEAFSADIAQFQKIRESVGLPEHLLKKEAKRNGKELDLNRFFEVFGTLSLKNETSLEWVYSLSELGGSPIVYTRDNTQKPFETSAEFMAAIRKEAELDQVDAIWKDYRKGLRKLSAEFGDDPFSFNREAENAREKLQNELDKRLAQHPRREYWNWWRESILTDGSAQSYLELAALFLLADQFALWWHSRYNDLEILPSKAALLNRTKRHFWEWEGEKEYIPDEVSAKALKLDPTPKVHLKADKVEVSLLTFTKWGGFQRKTIVFSKAAPHVVKSVTEKIEVEWDCGITY